MTTWGSTERYARIGVDWWGIPPLTKDTASIDVGADLIWSSTTEVPDNTNTTYWDWVGYGTDPDGSDSAALKLSSFKGEKLFKSLTRPVSTIYGQAQNIALNAWVNGLEWVPDGQLDVSATFTVPARPYQFPRPPQNATVTRNSDTSHTVTWTGDYTDNAGGYPWANIYLYRWDNTTNVQYLIATLPYNATSYTDTTTAADHRYQYHVSAENSTGYSSYASTAYVYTTPSAHTNLQWAKSTSDVVLTWSKASTLTTATEVEESAGGGAWTAKATVAAGTNTWTHTAPNPAVTHQYRVRPVASGAPTAAWTTSTVVQLLAPPLAPTALAPSGVTVDPNGGSVAATWAHNTADGTAQTAYEHQIKESGGSYTSSGKVTSTASSRNLTGLVRGKTYVHQSRTWGQHADPGPWSAEESFTTGAQPQTSVIYPTTADHSKSSLTASWTYYDADGSAHVASQVDLWNGSEVVYAATLGSVTSHSLAIELNNLTAYQFRVRVQDASGLWSPWASVVFSTEFIPPTTPIASGTFSSDTGSCSLNIVNPGADGTTTVEPVSNAVYRLTKDQWVLVAADVPLNTTITDQVPALGANVYKVVAWSATPTSAEAQLTITASSPWLYVNGGPGNSVMAKVKGGTAVGLTAGRPKVLHQFVGSMYPVEFTGNARTKGYAISGAVDGFSEAGWGAWQAWEAIADLPAPLIYRDPLGRYENVSISDVQIDHDTQSRKAKVSATLTVVK